ncbi:hypothetical protein L3Y34_014632 [Caenorhabditis briggsae]|uniref:Uncharacterized protein n=1 Tax=Caenorhabditis briggsae TaxID=6238 RepID=A0AAE9IXV5_CAEBR|nr:hypothetical protein L3Y34_014632 [Caenorhabditis briggsae]
MSSGHGSKIIKKKLISYDYKIRASAGCNSSPCLFQPFFQLVLHYEEGDLQVLDFTPEQLEKFVIGLKKSCSNEQ